MIRSVLSSAAVLGAIAGQTLASGTITNGNASLQIVGKFDSNLPNANLIADTGAADQLAQLCWYYRTPGNNQNSFFSLLDNPIESYVGNTATLTWTNAGPGPVGNERFNATLTIVLEDDAAPNTLRVTQTMVFQSSAANTAARTFNVFNVLDMDLNATPANDALALTNASSSVMTFTETASSNYSAMQAEGLGSYEANTGSALRTKMNGGAQNLSNSGGPISGDVGGAFQWTLPLQPGESRTLVSRFTLNVPLPPPSCYANCDASSTAPILNANDFNCFLNAFAAGLSYANCDNSTTAPVLNANDFNCFLNAFAAGCS